VMVGHLVERFPWYMIHVIGSNERLVMEPAVDRGINTQRSIYL
jgi:hypothetical protein